MGENYQTFLNGGVVPPFAIQDSMQGQWVVPNILKTTDQTYVSVATSAGFYRVHRYVSLASITPFSLSQQEQDDHDVAALCETQTGKVLAAYCRHSLNAVVNWRRFDPADSTWTTAATIATSDVTSYTHLHRLTGSVRIWLLYRIGNSASGNWAIRFSDDEGVTWSGEIQLAPNTYMASYPDPNGVHIRCYAYDHPVNGTDHDIYYFRVDLTNGDVIDSTDTIWGNAITGVGLPISRAHQHKAVDVADPVTTRLYEAGKIGVPAILASEFIDETGGTYYRYVYNTATGLFTRRAVATSGPAFFASGSDYFGGACFDETNLNIVYCARNLGVSVGAGSWELVRMKTVDVGVTWTRDAVIRVANNILCRPQVKAGRIWWCEVGRYVDFNQFSAGLCSLAI